MNPEEIQLLREGRRLMQQARDEASMPSYHASSKNDVSRSPEHKKKRIKFSFPRFKHKKAQHASTE
eukprot:scaffold23585_cov201-Cylindrotheca_fusiformis.AAC.1